MNTGMFALVKAELSYHRNVLLSVYGAILVFYSLPVPMDKTGYTMLIATMVVLHAYLLVVRRKGGKERYFSLMPMKRNQIWLARLMFQLIVMSGAIVSVAVPLWLFHGELTKETILMRLVSLFGINLMYIVLGLSWIDTRSIARNQVVASIYPVSTLLVWFGLYLCYISPVSLGFMLRILGGSGSPVQPFIDFDGAVAALSVLGLSLTLLIVEHELYRNRKSYIDSK